jgi:hypothetical protein
MDNYSHSFCRLLFSQLQLTDQYRQFSSRESIEEMEAELATPKALEATELVVEDAERAAQLASVDEDKNDTPLPLDFNTTLFTTLIQKTQSERIMYRDVHHKVTVNRLQRENEDLLDDLNEQAKWDEVNKLRSPSP